MPAVDTQLLFLRALKHTIRSLPGQFSLPQMTFKANPEISDATEVQLSLFTEFWLLEDIFQFDNVGVSRDVDVDGRQIKYLTCADCEIGPIGWYAADDKKAIYLCVNERVAYD